MKIVLLLTAAAIVTAPVLAAPCRDAKGKFTKCPTATATTTGITKDKNGKCHAAGGKFVACPK